MYDGEGIMLETDDGVLILVLRAHASTAVGHQIELVEAVPGIWDTTESRSPTDEEIAVERGHVVGVLFKH